MNSIPRTTRIIHRDGRTYHFVDQRVAYAIWLALPRGTRAAFRGKGDATPVYSHDCLDTPMRESAGAA